MRRSLNRLLCVAITAVLAACNLDVAQPANEPSDPATETFDPSLKIDISKMQKTTAGTYYRDVTIGTGLTLGLGAGKFAVLSYVGFLKNASPFAQSLNQLIALSSLPPGLQDGLAGARVRERSRAGRAAELDARLRRHPESSAVVRTAAPLLASSGGRR
jgi:hypothetical protein